VVELPFVDAWMHYGGGTHATLAGDENAGTPVAVRVHDGRPEAHRFTLERQGFELASAPLLGLAGEGAPGHRLNLYDQGVAYAEFYPRCERLVLEHLPGARRAVAFDHIVRRVGAVEEGSSVQGRLAQVHGDYTARSGLSRARQLLGPYVEEGLLERVLQGRVAIFNVWHPMKTVQADPLAMCTWASISPRDVLTTRLHMPSRVGETYRVKPSEDHRWVYFSEVTGEEAVLLKTFDSQDDGSVARFCLHSAFSLPEQERRAAEGRPPLPQRESLEVRVLVLWDEEAGPGFAGSFVPPHMVPGSLDNPDELTSGDVRIEVLDLAGEW